MSVELVGIIAIALIVVGLVILKKQADEKTEDRADGPITLHPIHGGGVCDDPDWQKVRRLFIAALIQNGDDPSVYENYVDSGYENIRTHYERFGGTYPAHVSPC